MSRFHVTSLDFIIKISFSAKNTWAANFLLGVEIGSKRWVEPKHSWINDENVALKILEMFKK